MLAVSVVVYVDSQFDPVVVGLYVYFFVLCAVGSTFKGFGEPALGWG
jgi:hypothetical protein